MLKRVPGRDWGTRTRSPATEKAAPGKDGKKKIALKDPCLHWGGEREQSEEKNMKNSTPFKRHYQKGGGGLRETLHGKHIGERKQPGRGKSFGALCR